MEKQKVTGQEKGQVSEVIKREISFKPDAESENILSVFHEIGKDLKGEIERLSKKGLNAEELVFDLYLDSFDIRLQSRGRSLLKGTKTRQALPKAEVIKSLTEWEPSIGGQKLSEDEKSDRLIEKMSPEMKRLLIAKLSKQ
jgi:hypothetical protein